MTISDFIEPQSILNDTFVITGGKFNSAAEFSEYITEVVYMRDISYMDAVIEFCEENMIDIENIKPIVHPTLKEALYAEAVTNNMIKIANPVVALPF